MAHKSSHGKLNPLRRFHAAQDRTAIGGRRTACIVLSGLCLAFATASTAHGAPAAGVKAAPGAQQRRPTPNYGKIPLSFEANEGQTDPRVQFLSRGSGYSLFLAPGEVVLSLERQQTAAPSPAPPTRPGQAQVDTLRMKLVGANPTATVAGIDPQPGVVSYFIGNDPKKWHSGIKTYGKVNYAGVYPGVNLVFYGSQRRLEYDFVVAPGADASRIAWQIDGARPSIDADGNLVLAAANGPASFKKPVVYQMYGDRRKAVEGAFAVAGNQIHFMLGSYDHLKPLVIDPVLSYASYLGGSLLDNIGNTVNGDGNSSQALAVDKEGSAYVTGYTFSSNFPLKDPYQEHPPAKPDSRSAWAFVTKFSPDGRSLAYSTYLGGTDNDLGYAIAVDSEGSAYITGLTSSPDFPATSGSYQTICGAGWTESISGVFTRIASCPSVESAYVTKLTPDGTGLAYSTFLSGFQGSIGNAIAVDGTGRAYVTGYTHENCGMPPNQPGFCPFPTTGDAIISGSATGGDSPDYIFVSVFDPTGATLLYSTLYGDMNGIGADADLGNGGTYATAIAVDGSNNFYVGGYTQAGVLPTTAGVIQPTSGPYANNGRSLLSVRGYVAKFSSLDSGNPSLVYGTYLGGKLGYLADNPTGLAADTDGNVYITGQTTSPDFPVTKGAFQTTCGLGNGDSCSSAFVTKLNPAATKIVWSSYLGNTPALDNNSTGNLGPIVLDKNDDVYVTGKSSGIFYFVNPVEQSVAIGTAQVFVTEFDPTGSKLLFSTYVGSTIGTSYNNAAGLAVDGEGNIYVAGDNAGAGLITTPGAAQTKYGGGVSDGFVVKIAAHGKATIKLSATPSPAAPGEAVTLTAAVAGPPNSSSPAGTVTFKSDSKVLKTVKLGSTGTATCTTPALIAGSYTVVAVYSGDETYSSSTSAVLNLNVEKIDTSTTLKAAPNPAFTRERVTFTAEVLTKAGAKAQTGKVTFWDGTKTLAVVTLNSSGIAAFSTESLTAGSHSVTASYAGNSRLEASKSKAVDETIHSPAATTTALSASAKSVKAGASVAFTAKVKAASGSAVPAGKVSFHDGTKLLGTETLDSKGAATLTTTKLAQGSHSITAAYAGDEEDKSSASSALTVEVTAQ